MKARRPLSDETDSAAHNKRLIKKALQMKGFFIYKLNAWLQNYFSVAMSITKRYFTSPLSIRS